LHLANLPNLLPGAEILHSYFDIIYTSSSKIILSFENLFLYYQYKGINKLAWSAKANTSHSGSRLNKKAFGLTESYLKTTLTITIQ